MHKMKVTSKRLLSKKTNNAITLVRQFLCAVTYNVDTWIFVNLLCRLIHHSTMHCPGRHRAGSLGPLLFLSTQNPWSRESTLLSVYEWPFSTSTANSKVEKETLDTDSNQISKVIMRMFGRLKNETKAIYSDTPLRMHIWKKKKQSLRSSRVLHSHHTYQITLFCSKEIIMSYWHEQS